MLPDVPMSWAGLLVFVQTELSPAPGRGLTGLGLLRAHLLLPGTQAANGPAGTLSLVQWLPNLGDHHHHHLTVF